MTRLAQAFWAIATLDALLLAVFFVLTLQDGAGQHDGGREMAMFFFVLVPAGVLGAAMLMFHFSAAWPIRWLALCIVVVPGLWFAAVQVDDWLIDRRIEANRAGTGYFDSDAMRRMGAAVVARDVATLLRLGATLDINTPGHDEMTLLRLALDSLEARDADAGVLPVVSALLALGARADDAMPVACGRRDAALLELLLAAGGNPNLRVTPQQPLVFATMSRLTPRNFRLLAAHGLDLNSRSDDGPLAVQLVIYRRWDLLAIALELGADMSRERPDGRGVASELARQIAEEIAAGRAPPPDLLRARQLLAAVR